MISYSIVVGKSIKLWLCVLSLSLRCWRERCRFKAKTGKRRWPWSSSKTLYTVRALISNHHLTAFITALCTSEKRRARLSCLPPPSQPRGKRGSYFRGDKVQHSGGRWGTGEIREMDSSVLIAIYNSEGWGRWKTESYWRIQRKY